MLYEITNRETEILNLLAQDYTTHELAQRLHISSETVRSHRKNLLRKFGVKTSAGLICKGFEAGLITH